MIDNKEIEKRLASAFDAAAPDMLDDLMAELKLTPTSEIQRSSRKKLLRKPKVKQTYTFLDFFAKGFMS